MKIQTGRISGWSKWLQSQRLGIQFPSMLHTAQAGKFYGPRVPPGLFIYLEYFNLFFSLKQTQDGLH